MAQIAKPGTLKSFFSKTRRDARRGLRQAKINKYANFLSHNEDEHADSRQTLAYPKQGRQKK